MNLTDNPSVDEVHLAAASLLPFDEIKVDTDLLRGTRTTESDELICKICHTYFLGCAPKVTRCAHAFCGDCLESWIQVQPTFRSWAQVAKTAGQARLVPCPVCKHPLNDKTDIHLILSDHHEPACVRMSAMLRFLPLVCHNSPSVLEGGACAWQGTYVDYQAHALTCVLNKTKSLIEANTTAPPETHQAKSDDTATVFIPYEAFVAGTKIRIEEKSNNGWIFASLSDGTGSWIPEWTIKKFDAWFEEGLASQGKHVEKCAAIRDFEPSAADTMLPLKEGEVFTVCERGRTGWNLVITSDGTRQGWVPDNRCKVIREGSNAATVATTASVSLGTFVAKRAFDTSKKGELSLSPGDTVSVRQAHESGWTLGTVVSGGTRKEGWFPDWAIERSTIEYSGGCLVCGDAKNLCTFVKRNTDLYGPICSEKCWEQWNKKSKVTPISRR